MSRWSESSFNIYAPVYNLFFCLFSSNEKDTQSVGLLIYILLFRGFNILILIYNFI